MVKRLLWAVLVASLLAVGLAKVKAEDFVIYYPGICHYLEPYGYWWYYWDCGNSQNNANGAALTEEVAITEPVTPDISRVTIRRHYTDGSQRTIERFIPRRRGR